MISYAPYLSANNVYIPPSIPSVIVRNDSSYKNSSIPVPEAYLYNRTPTILTVPAVKLESNKDPRQAKSMHYSSPISSSVSTSHSKGYNSSPEPHHPGPLLNTHGRYALYPPLTDRAQRELDTPPPAHLNAMMSNALPTFVPVAVPVDDLQTEARSSTSTSSIIVTTASSVTTSSNVPITNSTSYDSSPSTPPPILMPATYTEMSSGIRTHYYKLKKVWLQRYLWAKYLKGAGVNIDQNSSYSFFQMDDIPPVLQCEIIKRRKISKTSSDDNTEVSSPPVILPSTSSSLYEPSTSSGTVTKRCRKRKILNPTTSSKTRSTTDNARPSETEKRVPPIKIFTKKGR